MNISVKDLSFGYNQDRLILNRISLNIPKGEILGILGPNGTGKTTLIKCLNGILRPQQGDVFLGEQRLESLSPAKVAKLLAYVPQYADTVFATNVVDTVMLGRLPYAGVRYSEEDRALVFAIMRKLDLEKLAFRSLREISGGERQRVFIARALAQQPQAMILDEPTSSLDLYHQLFTLHTIAELARNENLTVIMTIHDLNLAAMFCDKLLMLKEQRIFAYGTPQEVLQEETINAMYRIRVKVTVEDGYQHVRLIKAF